MEPGWAAAAVLTPGQSTPTFITQNGKILRQGGVVPYFGQSQEPAAATELPPPPKRAWERLRACHGEHSCYQTPPAPKGFLRKGLGVSFKGISKERSECSPRDGVTVGFMRDIHPSCHARPLSPLALSFGSGWKTPSRSSSPTAPPQLPRPPLSHVPKCHTHTVLAPPEAPALPCAAAAAHLAAPRCVFVLQIPPAWQGLLPPFSSLGSPLVATASVTAGAFLNEESKWSPNSPFLCPNI